MANLGPRKPIIIPIPKSYIQNIDTLVTTQPCSMKIDFTSDGWGFYRKTIYPYIWQGFQVKLRACPIKELPITNSTDTSTAIFQTITVDFVVKAVNGTASAGGAFGMYFSVPAVNTQTNALMKWTDQGTNNPKTLYTENGIDYSYYSYVIYP